MAMIGGHVGYRMLKLLGADADTSWCDGSAYQDVSKLEHLLGPQIWSDLAGKHVIDFGCGEGAEAIQVAQRGARRVIGLDIRECILNVAREAAEQAGVSDRCVFTTETTERADVIISVDSFEHFADPGNVLRSMRSHLHDHGYVIAVFGPTWYHPLGGHLFSVFPWSHLLFTEHSLIRWRSDFKSDGATRFGEVEGGLNQMTIHRFERLIASSDFRFDTYQTVPIRKLRLFANRFTREFTTAVVKCRLVPRSKA